MAAEQPFSTHGDLLPILVEDTKPRIIMQTTNGIFLHRIAIAGAGFLTAVVAALAIAVDPGTALSLMAPLWLMTMIVAAATYAAGSWFASRTAATHLTIDLTADERVKSVV